MKKSKTYYILNLRFSQLLEYAFGEYIRLDEEALKKILRADISASGRSLLDMYASAEETARQCAEGIPYNPALRQIARLTADTGTDLRKGPSDPYFYLHKLLYVEINSPDKKEELKMLLDGLTVQFSRNCIVRFVPFERSASQVRTNMLVMIAEEVPCVKAGTAQPAGGKPQAIRLAERMAEIVRCGIPEDSKKFCIAKYAAYRALMMTSGICIGGVQKSPDGKEFIDPIGAYLNADSVIVVRDFQLKHWYEFIGKREDLSVRVSTVDYDKKKEKLEKIRYAEKTKDASEDKLFDGEGLVSVEMARVMAAAVADSNQADELSSFMIRMPFVKGVVHKVDFHRFFGLVYGTQRNQTLTIMDAFGRERNLSKVHMILTVSMFKMYAGYYEKNKNNYENVYWNAFREHDHCLFVCNCDEKMRQCSHLHAISSYQFLSTMQQEYAERLCAPSAAAAWTEANSRDAAVISYLMRTTGHEFADSNDSGDDERTDIPEEQATDARLLMRCPKLVYTDVFWNRVRKSSLRQSCAYGHLCQPGIMRYLSGDLMQLLVLLTTKISVRRNKTYDKKSLRDMRDKKQELRALWDEICTENPENVWYYAPGAPQEATEAVIQRSPHLSRQEHVIAQPLKLPENSFRAQYMQHLRGVLMLRTALNRAVARLGGADFDGDLVKIYFGRDYIAAATYSDNSNLPLSIPSEKTKDEVFDEDARKKLILRSIGGRVGQFSNSGFQLSLFAQGWRNREPDQANNRERAKKEIVIYSAMTGMEIDSAKNGCIPVPPNQNVSTGCGKKYALRFFIDTKNYIKKKKGNPQPMDNIPPDIGRYSLVEYLPYIFAPKAVLPAEHLTPDDWAENYRNALWKLTPKVSQKKDPDTALTKRHALRLYSLVTPGETSCSLNENQKKNLSAVMLAVRAVLQGNRSFTGRTDEKSAAASQWEVFLDFLGELGDVAARQLSKMLHDLLYQVFTQYPLETVAGWIFDLVPWEHLQDEQLRLEWLRMQFNKKKIPFQCNEKKLLLLCKNVDDSKNQAEKRISTTDRKKILIKLLATGSEQLAGELQRGFPYLTPQECKSYRELAQQLQCNDQIGSKPDVSTRLKEIADLLQNNSVALDWMLEPEFDKRKKYLTETVLSGIDSKKAPDFLVNALAAPQFWQALLHFLLEVYAVIRKNNTQKAQGGFRMWVRSQEIEQYFPGIHALFAAREQSTAPTAQEFAALLKEAVAEIMNKPAPDMEDTAFSWNTVLALSRFPAQECFREGKGIPMKELRKKEYHFPAPDSHQSCSVRALLLFVAMTAGKGFLEQQLLFDTVIQAVVGIGDNAVLVRALLEQEEQFDARLKETGCMADERKELRSKQTALESLVCRLYPDKLYAMLKPAEMIRAEELSPDFAVGYLDGCQYAGIGTELPSENLPEMKVTVTAAVVSKLPESASDLMKYINITGCAANAVVEFSDDTASRLHELLWKRLVKFPFVIKVGGNVVYSGAMTVLYLPDNPWYHDITGGSVSITAELPGALTGANISGMVCRKEPLAWFIFGYRKYSRIQCAAEEVPETESEEDDDV